MYSIRYFESAKNDLLSISSYIGQDNPFLAKKVVDSIYRSVDYLQEFPYLGKEIVYPYRELVSKYKYRIVYIVLDDIIYIVSVFKFKELF